MLKASTDAPADNIPLPEPDHDEELLLDAPEAAASSDFNTFESAANEQEDTEMVVDEEGRPKFAPGKDVVRQTPSYLLGKRTSYV
jgi:RNA-binding protein PNO1